MSYLVDRKTELQFRTASTVTTAGKARVIMVESRAKYAVVKLVGARERYPIAWEQIFHLAEKRHAENLRLEQEAAKKLASKGKLSALSIKRSKAALRRSASRLTSSRKANGQ